jgi:hypothetical protein
MSGDRGKFSRTRFHFFRREQNSSAKKAPRMRLFCFGHWSHPLDPWGLPIGQLWTPAMTWHGVGKLQSTAGAAYGLFLEVSPDMQ